MIVPHLQKKMNVKIVMAMLIERRRKRRRNLQDLQRIQQNLVS
jgi:hypothetical protein